MTEPSGKAPTTKGFFLSFEGIEGSGKSTQMKLLIDRLRTAGYRVTANQEPGTTEIGRQIRRITLDPGNDKMAPMTELLLMFASRAQSAAEIIRPALARAEMVISDRFTDSTLAYQGEARGLGFEKVWSAHRLALDELLPDLTICMKLDVEVGLARAKKRNTDLTEARLDQQSVAFHYRVSAGYDQIAALEPERFRFVDASGSVEQVAARVWTLVRSCCGI